LRTLSEIRTQIRTLTDYVDSSAVTDSFLTTQINLSLGTLRDLLIDSYGSNLFVSTDAQEITLQSGTSDYTLDSGIQKIEEVWYQSGSDRYRVTPHSPSEEASFQYTSSTAIDQRDVPYQYRLYSDEIRFIPTPGSGTIGINYIPVLTDLVNDNDQVESSVLSQWLQWVVLDVSIKVKVVTEEEYGGLLGMKKDLESKIMKASSNRVHNQRKLVPRINSLRRRWP